MHMQSLQIRTRLYLGGDLLGRLTSLSVICTASTGTNHIDTGFCKDKSITILSLTEQREVINKISSTAELALALTLAFKRRIVQASGAVSLGHWDYQPFIGTQLLGKKVGVVGYGRLGSYYAHYMDGLGCKVFVYDPFKSVAHPRLTQVHSLSELASLCSVISLHVHVSPNTIHMIDSTFFSRAQPDLLVVNTSRGEIVDEIALVDFLKQNSMSGYATDVLADEISGIQSSLIWKYSKTEKCDQVLITPHIGGMTNEAQNTAFGHAATMLKTFLESQ